MIKVTTWSPDTCGCVLHYEWDADLSPELRVHEPVSFAPRWEYGPDVERTKEQIDRWEASRQESHDAMASRVGCSVGWLRATAWENGVLLPLDGRFPGMAQWRTGRMLDKSWTEVCQYHGAYVGDLDELHRAVRAENYRKNRYVRLLAARLGVDQGLVRFHYDPSRRLSMWVYGKAGEQFSLAKQLSSQGYSRVASVLTRKGRKFANRLIAHMSKPASYQLVVTSEGTASGQFVTVEAAERLAV